MDSGKGPVYDATVLKFWSVCIYVGAAGCASQTTADAPPRSVAPLSLAPLNPSSRAAALVEAYLDERFKEQPADARNLGLHAYDGKVSEISSESVQTALTQAKEFLRQVATLDLAAIADPTRLDVQLAKLAAERTIFSIEQLRMPQQLLNYAGLFDVSGYLLRNYAPLERRMAYLLDQVESATRQVPAMLSMLDDHQPRTHLETARKIFTGMREYYQNDVRTAALPALNADPLLKARFDRDVSAALSALDKIVLWIDDVGLKQSNENFALGEEKFLRMLAVNEGLHMSLADLQKMADEDYRKNYAAFVETARRIDPALSTQQVVAKIAREHLPFEQVIGVAKRQLEQLLDSIQVHDIVSIGGTERALVEVTPPFERWNSAFLNPAGPFEVVEGSFYYLSPPDPSWPKEMQVDYVPDEGDLLSISIHEVYPGHFIQGLHQRKAPTRAQKSLDSYAFVEGWAHYTEQMMFDAGYGGNNPRLQLGQLENALLRNCRFLVALGLHTQGMTVEQAETVFEDKCFTGKGEAEQQAYRGTFDPGFLSYTLGKLQIMDLRREFFQKNHTHSLRDFHDWLLSFGAAPMALIRERLEGTPRSDRSARKDQVLPPNNWTHIVRYQ